MSAWSRLRLTPTHFIFLIVPVLLIAFWLRVQHLPVYPPGISNDEAVNVVEAFHISQTWNFPIYEDLGRPEPLFRIMQAIGISVYGADVWLVRLTAAFSGLLTIAAAYWCIAQALYDTPPAIRYTAAIVGAISLTIALGHITVTRSTYRAVPQPLFTLLAMGFLLRGLRTLSWRDFVLCSIMLAMGIYTYTAAYFVPLAFFPLTVILLIFHRQTWRQWLPRLVLTGVVTAVLISPVLLRLLDTPEAVIGRAGAVAGQSFEPAQLPQILSRLFFETGDQNPQYNAARADLIPEVFQAFFAIGFIALLLRIRQPASILFATLLLLSTIPVVLSGEIPHGLRIMGAYAVFPVIIASGIAAIIILLAMIRVPVQMTIMVILIASGGVLITQGLSAQQRYNAYWQNADDWRMWDVHEHRLNHNEWFFRSDRRQFAAWISRQQNTPLLMPLSELNRQTTRAWLLADYPTVVTAPESFALPEETRLIVPWSLEEGDLMLDSQHYALLHNQTITLLPPLSPDTLATLTEDIRNQERINGEGQLDLLGYATSIERPVIFQTKHRPLPGEITIADIQLNGWWGSKILSGSEQTIPFTLAWSDIQQSGHVYNAAVQLQTQDYERITGSDQPILRWLYPTTIWQNVTEVPDVHTLTVPDLAPGAYRLAVGVYPPFEDSIPVTINGITDTANQITLDWLKVPQPEMIQPGENTITIDDTIIDDSVALIAIEALLTESDGMQIRLYWQSLVDRPPFDATIFVHLLDENGDIVTQQDSRPWQGQYPTFIWDEDEIVRTQHDFNVENPENLSVRVGMYTFPGPVNLPVTRSGESINSRVIDIGSLSSLVAD